MNHDSNHDEEAGSDLFVVTVHTDAITAPTIGGQSMLPKSFVMSVVDKPSGIVNVRWGASRHAKQRLEAHKLSPENKLA